MKKIIIIILCLFIITACQNSNEIIIKEQETKIIEKLKEVENINEQEITNSINYINDNIDNSKQKEVIENLSYHALYLSKIGNKTDKNKDNLITNLGDLTIKYLNNNKKETKKEIKEILENINKNQSNYVEEFYNNYHINFTINNNLSKIEKEIIAEINTIGVEKNIINTSINYIIENYDNPLQNTEVIEKIIYYSVYLKTVGQKLPDNEITLLGTTTYEYLNTLDNNKKIKILEYINIIKTSKEEKINNFYQQVK